MERITKFLMHILYNCPNVKNNGY